MGELIESQPGAAQPEGGSTDDGAAGITAAVCAFGIWAVFPVYFNQFGPDVSPWEILLQRVIWAEVFLVAFILLTGRLGHVQGLLKRPRTVLALACSAMLLGTNWGTFIWAVTHAEVLQSSLGYYINPLLNVFLGYCFLGERLRRMQWLAVALAAAGVLISLFGYGEVPWLALMLAGCFGLYGLIRKQVKIDSVTGLMMETLLMTPIAAIWLAVMFRRGEIAFLQAGMHIDLLLIGSGLITILPLLLFVAAAKRLKLATVGLLQYIAPTGHFLIGVYLYGEPFTSSDAVTFGCIWCGLVVYTTDMLLAHRSLTTVGRPTG